MLTKLVAANGRISTWPLGMISRNATFEFSPVLIPTEKLFLFCGRKASAKVPICAWELGLDYLAVPAAPTALLSP